MDAMARVKYARSEILNDLARVEFPVKLKETGSRERDLLSMI